MRKYALCLCCIFLLSLTTELATVLAASRDFQSRPATQRTKDLAVLRQAAEQGNADAQTRLGIMYIESVPRDYPKAVEWFQKAAAQGYAPGQYCLGVMYIGGHGVPKDERRATEWFQKAAAQGHVDAKKALEHQQSGGRVFVDHGRKK